MPDLPEDVVAVEQEILSVLSRSEQRILAQQQAITDDIREGRKAARLDALLEQVQAEREIIETGTKNWLESAVPYTFNSGSVSTGLTDSAQWNRVNLSAVQEIIDFHYGEILSQTPYMEPAAKRWFRDAARAGNELSATTGLTRVQQARLIRSQAPQAFDPSGRPLPLAPVIYKNGSRHTMREYSNMLARTTTALTFNRGSLNTIEELGGAFVEVFDGADCGATGHDDPDKVNGTIRTIKWAGKNLISHPNCRRSFGARFDVTEEDLTQRSTSISREALADQARFERQLAARAAQRPATGRQARTGRVGRAAKKALEEARRQALAAAQAEARRRLLQEELRR